MAGQKPELVLAQYHWHIGPQGEVGTRKQFASLGIKTWISPADCTDKTVTETSNADGARSAPFSLAEITREVTDLATILMFPREVSSSIVRWRSVLKGLCARLSETA